MRKILLFLIVLLGANVAFAQQTYYWRGGDKTDAILTGADWNTSPSGPGTNRTTENNADVLIIDGSYTVDFIFTTNKTIKQLQIKGGAVVGFINTGTTAPSLTLNGDETTKSLLVNGGSTLKLDCNLTNGTLNFRLGYGGEIEDNSVVYLSNATDPRSVRLTSFRKLYPLNFNDGTSCYIASTTAAFGQNNTIENTPIDGANTSGNVSHVESIVFKSNANLFYKSGSISPFGNVAGGYSILKFETGSNFIYQHTHLTGFNLLKGRTFANFIFDTGSVYIASTNGDVFAQVNNLTIKQNANLTLNVTNVAPVNAVVNGNVVLEENTILDLGTHGLNLGANSLTTNSGSTIAVANAGGIDAAIVSTGTRTFHANTIYSFNAAAQTNAPFPASIPKISGVAQVGGIIVNAGPVRLTDDVNIASGGKLQFGTGTNPRLQLLTKNLTLQPGAIIERANTNGRIEAIGTGQINALGVNGAGYLLAVGNGLRDASVILETTSASDFSLNIANGVPEAISPVATGDNHVLATWNLNRTSGTGNFKAKFGWQDAWEQSNFLSLTNNNVSLYNYVSGAYAKITTEDARNGTGADNFVLATLNQGGIFIVAEGTNALPVTLSSFTAQKQGNSALIKWTTSSEQNNAYFEVQRSNDGHKFTTIGTRKGAGNSLSTINYSYTDFSPESGDNYYRLVQFDLNGNNTEYDPQVLNFHYQTSGFTVLTNQNTQQISFRAVSNNGGVAKVSLYTIAGAKVSSQSINISSGAHVYNLKTPHLTKGVYVIVYGLGNEVYREKLIK